MAGRKPKPTAVKKLEGNPGKRKLNDKEPMPVKGMPTCPAWLMPEAQTEWKRLAKILSEMGVLTEVDRTAFAAYCQSYARWKEAQEHINSEGATYETENGMQRPNPYVAICNTEQRLMMSAASEFGLTPSARSRIMAASGVNKDDVDEICSSHIYPSYVSCMSVKGHLAKARSYELLANEPLMLQSNAHDGLKFIDARYAMDMLKRCKKSYPQKEFHIIKMDAQYFGRIHPRWVVTI